MHQVLRASKRVATALSFVLLVACGGKLTQANFEKVTEGMTGEEVKELLGQPTQTSTTTLPLLGTITTYTYKTETSEASVTLHEDKVKGKAGSIAE